MAGGLFTAAAAARIAATVRRDEGEIQNSAEFGRGPRPRSAREQVVKVTSAGATTVGGVAQYPAVLEMFDAPTGTWADGGACWLVLLGGAAPAVNARYNAIGVSQNSDGTYVYVADGAAAPPPSLTVDTINPGTGDTTASVPDVLTAHVDQGSGLQVGSSTGGATTLSAQPATATHAGVVTLGGQVLGTGTKTVEKLALEKTAGTSTPGQDVVLSTVSLPFSTAEDNTSTVSALYVSSGGNDCGVVAHEFNWIAPGGTNTFRSFPTYSGLSPIWVLAANIGGVWQEWFTLQPNAALTGGGEAIAEAPYFYASFGFAVGVGGVATQGASGTDPIGNVFHGGIVTTLSTIVGASGTDATGSTVSGGLVTGIGTGSSLIRVGTPAGGDLSGTYPNPTVVKIQGVPVDTPGGASDAIAKYVAADGRVEWVSAGTGISTLVVTTPPEIVVNSVHSVSLTGPTATANFGWVNVTANYVLCGPYSGTAAQPAFRTLGINDLPQPVTASTSGGGACTVVGSWEDNGPVETLPGPGSYLITLHATGTAVSPPSASPARLSARIYAVDQNTGPITHGQTLVAVGNTNESRDGTGSLTVLYRYTTGTSNRVKVQSLLTGGTGGMGTATGTLATDADGNETTVTWVNLGP